MVTYSNLAFSCKKKVLNSILNQLELLNGEVSVLAPYMEAVRAKRDTAAAVVEKIEDWFAGRSLKNVNSLPLFFFFFPLLF